ncbi:CU044_2847 family protein [Lewinella sp. W8]|uniref:CU044_2847 family protein n=1 Tax=Lewinella sp. W8 TaxID=2528208 RepID=UPI0010677148|nr:CU044_2847 family protein [Lewinella sp. W8]MTB50749.1 hypothetical protein [Lewinella sp. W8]
MANPIELKTKYGTIYVEPADRIRTMRSGGDKIPTKTLNSVLGQVSTIGNEFNDVIKSFQIAPSEVDLELGIKFSAEGGVIISKVSTEATFTIKIKWVNNSKETKEVRNV